MTFLTRNRDRSGGETEISPAEAEGGCCGAFDLVEDDAAIDETASR